jgi:1-acyl-sn-glycerol-3-phosphate acyltransferase
MKAAMQWFPFVDVVGNRLPNRFIRVRPGQSERVLRAIEDLARGMGERDALVIFPEGANFTPRRRIRGIGRLFERGDAARAMEAEGLANVIAPRPGGVMAALRGAPEAEPVFVAHTGLEDLSSLRALWRAVPLRRPLLGRYWRLPRDEVPTEDDRIVDWLFAWWERIDTWIATKRAQSVDADAR